MVEVLSATSSFFPASTGRSFTAVGPTISGTAGTVAFGAFSLRASPDGANGDGVPAVLTLKALSEGGSGLAFSSAQVSDRAGMAQSPLTTIGGGVEMQPQWRLYLPLVMWGG